MVKEKTSLTGIVVAIILFYSIIYFGSNAISAIKTRLSAGPISEFPSGILDWFAIIGSSISLVVIGFCIFGLFKVKDQILEIFYSKKSIKKDEES